MNFEFAAIREIRVKNFVDPIGGSDQLIWASRVKHKAVAPSIVRVKADLAWLRGTITVPLWVIALK